MHNFWGNFWREHRIEKAIFLCKLSFVILQRLFSTCSSLIPLVVDSNILTVENYQKSTFFDTFVSVLVPYNVIVGISNSLWTLLIQFKTRPNCNAWGTVLTLVTVNNDQKLAIRKGAGPSEKRVKHFFLLVRFGKGETLSRKFLGGFGVKFVNLSLNIFRQK